MASQRLLSQSMKNIQLVCGIAGIDLYGNKHCKSKLTLFFNMMWLSTDFFGAVFYFIDGIQTGKTVVDLTQIGPCVTFTILGLSKVISITFNRNRFYKLLGILKKLEEKNEERATMETDEIIQKEVFFLHRIIKVLKISYICTAIAFALNPLGVILYKYYKTKEVTLVFPFIILYPFDAYNIKYWPAVYLHQLWSETIVLSWLSSADFLFFIFCIYIRVQFCLLKHELGRIVSGSTTEGDFQNKFRNMVMWHQEIIYCAQILEELYSKSNLINFVTSSLTICLTGFDAVMISDTVIVLTFVLFMATSLLQTFFMCWFGDMMMRSSTEVGDGAYNSLWYLKEATVGKSLLLIHIRSMKACKTTAYGFADVNLSNFTGILGKAWSYFALLNTIYGQKEIEK